MFGLSVSKILLTLFVIAAVWYGWRAYNRYQAIRKQVREEVERAARRGQARGETRGQARGETRGEAEDMVECSTCGAFIAAGRQTSCGRKDCPYPG